jgi:CheY-like chemotaxis protein
MEQYLQILIVDDDKQFNAASVKAIRENGITHCVKTALNGGHALMFLNQTFSDMKNQKLLILLDLKMPIMDGLEFLKCYEKCAYPYKENITIAVMVSNDTREVEIEEARKLGVYHFLQKPLSLTSIKRVLGGTPKLEKVA